MLKLNVAKLKQTVRAYNGFQTVGKLHSANGLLRAKLPAALGELCELDLADGRRALCEVIGFDQQAAQIMPYHAVTGIRPGARVTAMGRTLRAPVGRSLLGRVINGIGAPIDDRGNLHCSHFCTVEGKAPSPLHRPAIRTPFVTGQRVIDGLITCGKGQRVALFAGSGVGKSTLLGEIARGADSAVNVVAMIGERGREVRPFLEKCLGADGLARSIVIVSTSEETPLMRVKAAHLAVTVADYFRQQGNDVLLMLDSITRLATAQREIGLLLGEPPTARGFTPSVFQMLASLLERLGVTEMGSITGILTVLVDGDDLDEPLSDAIRSIVDGHIVLDRHLAEKGHFPAVNVSRSISRVFPDVASPAQLTHARKVRELLANHDEVADLVRVGAYQKGSSAKIDRALELMPAVERFLCQSTGTHAPHSQTLALLAGLADQWKY